MLLQCPSLLNRFLQPLSKNVVPKAYVTIMVKFFILDIAVESLNFYSQWMMRNMFPTLTLFLNQSPTQVLHQTIPHLTHPILTQMSPFFCIFLPILYSAYPPLKLCDLRVISWAFRSMCLRILATRIILCNLALQNTYAFPYYLPLLSLLWWGMVPIFFAKDLALIYLCTLTPTHFQCLFICSQLKGKPCSED